jgi:hypothetical protein
MIQGAVGDLQTLQLRAAAQASQQGATAQLNLGELKLTEGREGCCEERCLSDSHIKCLHMRIM